MRVLWLLLCVASVASAGETPAINTANVLIGHFEHADHSPLTDSPEDVAFRQHFVRRYLNVAKSPEIITQRQWQEAMTFYGLVVVAETPQDVMTDEQACQLFLTISYCSMVGAIAQTEGVKAGTVAQQTVTKDTATAVLNELHPGRNRDPVEAVPLDAVSPR